MKKRQTQGFILGFCLILTACSALHRSQGAETTSSIDKNLDDHDRSRFAEVLENNPKGEVSYWQNTAATITYTLTVVKNVNYQDNPYCRQFRLLVSQNGQHLEREGIACRKPNGFWKIEVSAAF